MKKENKKIKNNKKEEKQELKVKISFSKENKLSLEDIIENYLCLSCIKI